MLNAISAFFAEYGGILLTGTRDTLLMVVISTLFAYVLGLPLGVDALMLRPALGGVRALRPKLFIRQQRGTPQAETGV